MIEITCESCGKKYRIDETKMRGDRAKVKCKACSHVLIVTKPRPKVIAEAKPVHEAPQPPLTPDISERTKAKTPRVRPSETEPPPKTSVSGV